jgi:hypothetical protein
MAFIIPMVMAVGSALGTAGTAIGSAIGIGEAAAGAATVGATTTAATGLFGTGISAWQGLSLIGSGISAFSSYTQGQAQADAYKLQATNAIIEGNQRSMEYQRQGLSVMSRMAETNATINARAGAGGIDPFSGSAGDLSTYAFAKGADEYNWAKDNASSAILQGESNAAAYRSAASSAASAGTTNAVGSLLMAGARLGSLYGGGSNSLLKPVGGNTGFASPAVRA